MNDIKELFRMSVIKLGSMQSRELTHASYSTAQQIAQHTIRVDSVKNKHVDHTSRTINDRATIF